MFHTHVCVTTLTIHMHLEFVDPKLLTGRSYEAEICTILFLLKCSF